MISMQFWGIKMYEVYARLRDEKGVLDATIAKATGIGRSTFSDWKNGRSTPMTFTVNTGHKKRRRHFAALLYGYETFSYISRNKVFDTVDRVLWTFKRAAIHPEHIGLFNETGEPAFSRNVKKAFLCVLQLIIRPDLNAVHTV